MEDLGKKLNELCNAQPFNMAWHVKDVTSGKSADRAGSMVVASRSTRKVSIMMALLKAINDGAFSMTEQIRILEKYQNTTSGVTPFLLPNLELSLRDAMILMIIVSDNPCTATIVDMLGTEYINKYCQSIGMKHTIHRFSLPLPTTDLNVNTVISARDQGLLLEMILKGSRREAEAANLGCTMEQCRFALNVMSWQRCDLKIASMLPVLWPPNPNKGAMVAGKGGIGPGMHCETGIVFRDGKPLFILCMYTWDVPETLHDGTPGAAGVSRFMGLLARTVWDALSGM
ncbi:MAG: serine hydrolase [Deltaproteobacteria bacterium]|nr:serine hydrolase [Deltaproteobacteria bacterium]